jgi:tRNA (cmo5U34)-methyltransferase
MSTPLSQKATVEEIRRRFDAEVERFSNLETGQAATIDAPLAMELITKAAAAATPGIGRVLDLGCGAGNNTLRLLRECPGGFACDLCDLSLPMLQRARARVAAATTGAIRILHGDFRTLALEDAAYDVVLAAAVLHHLRDDRDWEAALAKIHRVLRPGGSLWVTDLVSHENPRVQEMMWRRYGAYLESLGGAA